MSAAKVPWSPEVQDLPDAGLSAAEALEVRRALEAQALLRPLVLETGFPTSKAYGPFAELPRLWGEAVAGDSE